MTKQPVMHPRDSGGSFTLNNSADGTPIREMYELDDGLCIITDKCTYKIRLADQVDPSRNNPSLPHNFQQKLFDHGIDSPLLCRVLLQAKVMFRKEFQSIDVKQGMRFSLEALCNVVAMEEIAQRFATSEKTAMDRVQNGRSDASVTVPSVGNVRAECKSFFQKADHFAMALMDIVRLFYSEMARKHWEDFRQLVKARYGEDDVLTKLLAQATPFLKLIRDTRDCLEHNLDGVKTWDFAPQADGGIAIPSIEVDFRKSTLSRCSLSSFLMWVTDAMQVYFEMIVVHMCSKSMRQFAGLPLTIGEVALDLCTSGKARFVYGSYDETGRFISCG